MTWPEAIVCVTALCAFALVACVGGICISLGGNP